ncbi:tyrosine-type recombinase/integrase [Clostridium sp.]|uniref:tyrosine-type recombinase/integrase n=1 Tax=Clostridium sp. TaxID=1506 RepID=UPI003D6C94A9
MDFLRHTYATRLFELGEEAKTVQELLGHANISITLDTYTHVLASMKKKATQKLNELYISMGVK